MIVSHKYRFIFLKTTKTAGTSIEIALSKFCGDKDIITPITPEDEIIRSNLGYRGPQNYMVPLSDYSLRDLVGLLTKRKRRRFYNHISARYVAKLIGEGTWNEYYKFCFERNPWDRVISLYYWCHRSEPRPTISEFVDSVTPRVLRKTGYEVYTIDDEVVVDRVCLCEYLQEELENIRNLLGLPERLVLPRAKASYREDKRHYSEILNDVDKEKIEKLFRKEIGLFGYEY